VNPSVPKNKGGRPKLNKRTVSIRLSESVLAQVRKAAATGGNISAYIEEAIKVQLKKDGIK
jgi:predicted DNA binding CopG/RHH family protein